jgi:AAA-like domain
MNKGNNMRFFTTAGPVNPRNHYYVPHRINEVALQQFIDQEKYFILHAPRQSGKTTAMRIFVDQLNGTGKYKAFYINFEAAQANRNNMIEGLRTILVRFRAGITNEYPEDSYAIDYLTQQVGSSSISGSALYEFLQFWSKNSDKPIILFIDEIDSLVGDTLITVLRQLSDGYINRSSSFPRSVCFIGVRDVRDYRIWSETEHNMVLGGSAFNIKAKSLTLPNFSVDQLKMLYLQHTHDTGQHFTDEAIEYAFYLTQGQPWLVNALAYQACFEDVIDRTQSITKEVIEHAKEELILGRDTHIDQLVHKLREPRVRNIIDAILSGQDAPEDFPIDDVSYVIDLGLISKQGKSLAIANPIYQEVIPRELSYSTQLTITFPILLPYGECKRL